MSLVDLFGHGEHKRNLGHFAAIASLAKADGVITEREEQLLDRFARKLGVNQEEYKTIMKSDKHFPIVPPVGAERRLERLYDLFRIIFADHEIEENEMSLVKRYALGLGYTEDNVDQIVHRAIIIFSGKFDFEDFLYLMNK